MKKILCICLLGFSAISVGCSGVPAGYVRTYHDSVGAGYLWYMEKDPDLTEKEKVTRRQTVATMERVLQEIEK